MIVLDAYAVLALLKNEPAAGDVERLLSGTEHAALTTIGIAEVVDHLIRITGADPEDAALDLAQLGLATGVDVDSALMLRAGISRAHHYHRRDRQVSLADCAAAEVARREQALLATSDPHLLDLCQDEGVGLLALPDSTGRTWSPPNGTS